MYHDKKHFHQTYQHRYATCIYIHNSGINFINVLLFPLFCLAFLIQPIPNLSCTKPASSQNSVVTLFHSLTQPTHQHTNKLKMQAQQEQQQINTVNEQTVITLICKRNGAKRIVGKGSKGSTNKTKTNKKHKTNTKNQKHHKKSKRKAATKTVSFDSIPSHQNCSNQSSVSNEITNPQSKKRNRDSGNPNRDAMYAAYEICQLENAMKFMRLRN